MKKYLFLFSFLLTLNTLYCKDLKLIISDWESLIRIDEMTDEKRVFLSKRTTSNSERNGELSISTGKDYLSIIIRWQDDESLSSSSTIRYRFDKENAITLIPKKNYPDASILYTIDITTKLNPEKEVIDFIKQILTYSNLIAHVNNDIELYRFNLDGLKDAIKQTDLSGTILEKYKDKL